MGFILDRGMSQDKMQTLIAILMIIQILWVKFSGLVLLDPSPYFLTKVTIQDARLWGEIKIQVLEVIRVMR